MSVLIEEAGPDAVERNISFLSRMRLLGQCCDAVLGTQDGGMFRVHKTIMSCCSSYFRILFRTSLGGKNWGDGDAGRKIIIVPNVSSDIMENIIDFAYCGQTLITPDNADYLFSAADQFNVQGIVQKCIDFILDNISPENCIGVWKFGKYYTLYPFEAKAFEYILANFYSIAKRSSQYLYLSLNELKLLLKEDALNVDSELLVWKAIKRWIDLKPSTRAPHVLELFQFVRLPVTSISELPSIVNEFFLLKNTHYSPYIKKVAQHVLQKLKECIENSEALEDQSQFRPRYPYQVLFCCSGLVEDEEAKTFEVYDSRADVWKQVEIENKGILPRYFHQCISIKQYIYIIGGNEGTSFVNSCYRFDSARKVFEEIAPMNEQRAYHCATEHAGKIYVFGGLDGFSRLNTVECYSPEENQWVYVEPMHITRSDASACKVRNRLFVVGGFNGLQYLKTTEVYDVEERQWHQLPEMLSARASLGCVVLDDCIYAVGGNNYGKNLKTVEKFSLMHEQWVVGKSMKLPRSSFGIQVMNNKIYVVGGFAGENDDLTNECEMFDIELCRWKRMAPMKHGRSCFGILVLSNIRNIRDYILTDEERRINRCNQNFFVDLEENVENNNEEYNIDDSPF